MPKTKSLLFLSLAFILFGISGSQAQTIYYDTIHKQKVCRIDIHKTYERVIEKGYASVEMFEYLGNYYYVSKDFQKSKQYFDILFKKYKLSQISLKSIAIYKTL